MMRDASPRTVDRLLGALVAVCASALIAALGSRVCPSLKTLLRLARYEFISAGENSEDGSKKQRSRGRRKASAGNGDDALPGEDEDDEGDAYFSYAYGSRSSLLSGMAAAEATRATRRGGEGGGAVLVVHVGSCHCGGLAFEVQAPEHLVALETPSKVRYPFITVPVECFQLTSDDRNGSLYLLKCRPSSGRNSTPKVSAHFFCRRCGVHVVHAPDFPHAVVANVNVHCIRQGTIKSLAVAFLRGGGVELPGIGDPVEGVYEVGRESWSDAMRERVSVALQQQQFLGDSTATALGGSGSGDIRETSPRRRSSPFTPARPQRGALEGAAWDLDDRGVHGRGGGVEVGVDGSGTRSWRNSREGIAAEEVARGVVRTMGLNTLQRTAEERNQPPLYNNDGFFSGYHTSPSTVSGAAAANSSTTWGEVLMHVASLHSSVQPRNGLPTNGVANASNSSASSANSGGGGGGGGSSNSFGHPGNNGRWGPRTSEILLRTEREARGLLGGSGDGNGIGSISGFGGGAFSSRGEGSADLEWGTEAERGGGDANECAVEGESVEGEDETALRPRRSISADSHLASNTALGSPARGVSFRDKGEEASGGSRSPAGGGWKDGDSWGGTAGGGSLPVAATGEIPGPKQQHRALSKQEVFVKSPSAEGVSGGFAAKQA